ncbi:MAG: translation elongation factor Ts [Bacteroidales bacterium]|jgi:elongation factor Ts|nr:translation elongation factor Ts [Bacteroidales bacterium]
MAKITASDVNKLRKSTGAGMMDCKKALVEADGDFDKATQIIREKGQAIANKRSDREASEGVVLAKTNQDNTKGAMISLNCETDFVAKNDDFVAIAEKILDKAVENLPADIDALKAIELDGKNIADTVLEQSGIIGEKIELSFFDKLEADYISAYIHSDKKLATLVGFNKAGFEEQVGKDVAMQVAAMNPVAVDEKQVSQEVIDQELEIGRNQALAEGKPENLVDKIAQGKLGKFYKENTLVNQAFIKEGKMTVKQYLQQVDKDLTVTDFKRYSIKQ